MDRNACEEINDKIQRLDDEEVGLFEILSKEIHEDVNNILRLIEEDDRFTEQDKTQIKRMLQKHVKCFSKNKDDLGFCPLIKHEIDIKENVSPTQVYHRLPLGLEERVDKEIENLLEKNIIRKSKSPWNSPIVVVKKPNNDLRICLNYRKLNAVTNRPTYHIPDSCQIFDSLEGAKFFSTLDLSNAYYQCEIKEEHKKFTAFNSRKDRYEFNRMPFGLCGAPFTFQKLMSEVLRDENWKSTVTYLDDVLIFSSSLKEHIKDVNNVLDKIEKAGLKLSPKKCHFFANEVKFLGHVISADGIRADPTKIEKIRNWEKPENVAEMRKFLGFCNYYRRHIYDYVSMSSFLEDALKNLDKKKSEKSIKVEWNEQMEKSFENLKMKLCSPPVLAFPKHDSAYILDTDASFHGIGAVLSQVQDGKERVISYASRKLTKYERSYCITRKELLAVYYFVNYFKQYLLGNKFRIRTDHKALTWLMGLKTPKTTQFCHWISELEIYDFTIEYRKGEDHINADFLSRIPDCEQCDIKHADPKKKRNVKIEYFPRANLISENFSKEKKNAILQQYHDELGHIGIGKMTELVLRNYEWNNIRSDIKNYVNKCFPCAERKSASKKKQPPIHITATKPLEKIMIDISGPLTASKNGYRYILGIVDVFTRFVMLIPIRNISSQSIVNILISRWVPIFGIPEILVSDGAYNLNSALINDLCDEFGIFKVSTSPYHPESNGIIERDFRTVKDMIYATINSYGGDWVSALPYVEMGMRSSKHALTKLSPYEVIFGKNPRLPQFIPENLQFEKLTSQDYISQLEKKRTEHRKEIENINKRRDNVETENYFRLGERVMIKCLPSGKVGVSQPRFEGPAEIIRVLNSKSYMVKFGEKVLRRHEVDLKRCHV